MCGSRKYPYLPPRMVFYFEPPPLWKFQFRFIRSFKLLAFVTLHPLRNIGVGMDILWNHTIYHSKGVRWYPSLSRSVLAFHGEIN